MHLCGCPLAYILSIEEHDALLGENVIFECEDAFVQTSGY